MSPWQANYYFIPGTVPTHTQSTIANTAAGESYYIVTCALVKSMVLWKCTNGTDVRGTSCIINGHSVSRLGTTTKQVQGMLAIFPSLYACATDKLP